MKKNNIITDDIALEYDFSNGVRGKHHKKMIKGYSITVNSPSKNANKEQVKEKTYYIKIDKDVIEVFKTSEDVNNALKAIIAAIPKTRKRAARTL